MNGSFALPIPGRLPLAASVGADAFDELLRTAVFATATLLVILLVSIFSVLARPAVSDEDVTPRAPAARAALPSRVALAGAVLATAVVFGLFLLGHDRSVEAAVAPLEAYEVQVVVEGARAIFGYPGGVEAREVLVLPRGRPVRVLLSAKDAVRHLVVPALRLSADLVPGTYTSTWFHPTTTGDFPMIWTGVEGTRTTMLRFVEADAFDQWLELGGDCPITLAQYGGRLYETLGCSGCHSLDGTSTVAPSFRDLFGRKENIARQGSVVVDDAYLRESILEPSTKIVQGYASVMPTLPTRLTPRQLDGLLAFIRAQGSEPSRPSGDTPSGDTAR